MRGHQKDAGRMYAYVSVLLIVCTAHIKYLAKVEISTRHTLVAREKKRGTYIWKRKAVLLATGAQGALAALGRSGLRL
jgi:hypothetical protein